MAREMFQDEWRKVQRLREKREHNTFRVLKKDHSDYRREQKGTDQHLFSQGKDTWPSYDHWNVSLARMILQSLYSLFCNHTGHVSKIVASEEVV